MHHPLQLAYLGIEVPDPSALDHVLRRRHRSRARRPGSRRARMTWRNDDKAQRVIVRDRPGQRRRLRRLRRR